MRAARFPVSIGMLEELLHMPPGSHITFVGMIDDRTFEVTATDPTLPEADEPHDTQPTVRRVEWNWNVK